MSHNGTTCELVDEGDLDTRYLSGRLSQEDAEAFEAHFFQCERCWGLVQQGLEIQATQEGAVPSSPAAAPGQTRTLPGSPAGRRPAMQARAWWGLAAAAVLVLSAIGIRQLAPGIGTGVPDDVLRGGAAGFEVTPGVSGSSLTATWPRLPEADLYRIRLYAADGTLLAERERPDTSILLARDSIGTLPAGGEAFWEVQALDRLRNPITRSELTKAVLPAPGR